MSSKEQETALEGIQRQRVGKLPHIFIHDQKLQQAFSPLFYVRGLQAVVSPTTQTQTVCSKDRIGRTRQQRTKRRK